MAKNAVLPASVTSGRGWIRGKLAFYSLYFMNSTPALSQIAVIFPFPKFPKTSAFPLALLNDESLQGAKSFI